MSPRRSLLALVPLFVIVGACGSSSSESGANSTAATNTTQPAATTAPGATPTDSTTPGSSAGGSTIDAARCAVNKAAGKITYLSGFDFAASASIVELLVAKKAGYFDDLCLDVDLKASFSTANYPLVAGGQAQFASAGSFSEMLEFGAQNSADFVALAVEGKTGIDALIVKDGAAATLADLKGKVIGVKGKITPSVKAMLAGAGLVEGTDYQTVLIDGFDPKVHIALPNIVGFPGYKSNEPAQLDAAGIKYQLFNPADENIPGSFGVLYTSKSFLDAHRDAATDFMRAAMKGLADAIADPAAATATAVEFINGNGNPNYLSADGEAFRWKTEAGLVTSTTPAGQPIGLPDAKLLQAEVDAYTKAGVFTDAIPPIDGRFDPSVITAISGPDGSVVWPG